MVSKLVIAHFVIMVVALNMIIGEKILSKYVLQVRLLSWNKNNNYIHLKAFFELLFWPYVLYRAKKKKKEIDIKED